MFADNNSQIEALYMELYDKLIVYAESALGSLPLAALIPKDGFSIH